MGGGRFMEPDLVAAQHRSAPRAVNARADRLRKGAFILARVPPGIGDRRKVDLHVRQKKSEKRGIETTRKLQHHTASAGRLRPHSEPQRRLQPVRHLLLRQRLA
tara:strand:- start:7587 stop:7898 length:312 start_codon:yes stop_codon:yes gene_type:complete